MNRAFLASLVAPLLLASGLRGQTTPPLLPAEAGFRSFETRIPMRDGKSLAADVYLPESSAGPFPAVLVQTPYNRKLVRPWFAGEGRWGAESLFTSDAFAFVVTDWRGRFESTAAASPGVRPGGSEDGFDTVAWIAEQAWSNGDVGSWGPSALGGAQYRTAVARPPALRCSVPVVMPLNLTHEVYFPGGALWEELVSTLSRLGWPLYDQLTARPTYDAFWEQQARRSHMRPEDIEVPMLLVGGWYDIYVDSVIETFEALRTRGSGEARTRSRLVIGPWLHRTDQLVNGDLEFPGAVGAGIAQAERFLEACLLGRGVEEERAQPRITYFQTGADEWRTTEVWPPPGTMDRHLYLDHDGSLGERPARAGRASFRYDPADPVETDGGHVLSPSLDAGPRDLSPSLERRSDVLSFSTPPLPEALEVAGRVRVELGVSSDRPDTDVTVWLTDVDPGGRSFLLTEGILRLRYRDSRSEERLLEPGQTYRVAVAMTHLAHTFRAGHRVRLLVSSSNHPRYARNLNDGGDQYRDGAGLVATNTIHWGPEQASALVLPSRRGKVPGAGTAAESGAGASVGSAPTRARAADGRYISWREHIIDDTERAGVEISGSDGLTMADLDGDGHLDVVSVHESDTRYDGVAEGHVRIAFGSEDPDRWELVTLSAGAEAGAAEDVAIGDVDGDGHLDVIAACELAHLVYHQNPGREIRTARWERVIPPITRNRGSFIRVFLADLNGDGRLEAVAPNKGEQNPPPDTTVKNPVSIFVVDGDPLDGDSWSEQELGRYVIPQNSEPVDLDGDGDLDVVVGARGERRILWFENLGGSELSFAEHPIEIEGTEGAGFNLAYADLNEDGRLDVVLAVVGGLAWIEQPAASTRPWKAHRMGTFEPDSMTGFALADVDGDGDLDVMAGSYSRGPRDRDGDVTPEDALGRLGWFEQPADPEGAWIRHDVSRRKRGMFDKFEAHDLDGDGDVDFVGTRGNSAPYDGVFWLEQVRTEAPRPAFERARESDSQEMPLPRGL